MGKAHKQQRYTTVIGQATYRIESEQLVRSSSALLPQQEAGCVGLMKQPSRCLPERIANLLKMPKGANNFEAALTTGAIWWLWDQAV